jgi:hypothetical protein
LLEENERLQVQLKVSEDSSEKILELESALLEAETKISDLLRVKEKFTELSEENLNQTLNLNELVPMLKIFFFFVINKVTKQVIAFAPLASLSIVI